MCVKESVCRVVYVHALSMLAVCKKLAIALCVCICVSVSRIKQNFN